MRAKSFGSVGVLKRGGNTDKTWRVMPTPFVAIEYFASVIV
jgi:hypothetical protein